MLEFKEVKILAFAKIKSYFSITYVKIILFKVLKKAYLIDSIRLMFAKAQKISLLFSISGGLIPRSLLRLKRYSEV